MSLSSNRHRISSRDRLSSIHRRNLNILKVIMAFVLFIIFMSLVLSTLQIDSQSMEPTLMAGARIIYHPLGRKAHVDRGDVVLVESPFYGEYTLFSEIINKVIGIITFQKIDVSLYPKESWVNRYLIKRVVAVPGDKIKMEDWILYVQSREDAYYLTEFERSSVEYDIYVQELPSGWSEGDIMKGDMEEIVLNENEYFILGDNRLNSNDSYYWGMLNRSRIKGKLKFTYWPLSQFGFIR